PHELVHGGRAARALRRAPRAAPLPGDRRLQPGDHALDRRAAPGARRLPPLSSRGRALREPSAQPDTPRGQRRAGPASRGLPGLADRPLTRSPMEAVMTKRLSLLAALVLICGARTPRSEERRVGKGWRARWWRAQC